MKVWLAIHLDYGALDHHCHPCGSRGEAVEHLVARARSFNRGQVPDNLSDDDLIRKWDQFYEDEHMRIDGPFEVSDPEHKDAKVVGQRNGFDLLDKPVTLKLCTKVPSKWLAVDLETKQVWSHEDGTWKASDKKTLTDL